MSLKRIFQGFWPQVKNTYFIEHLLMVAYDNILWEKQYFIFQQILIPLEKSIYAPVYSLFEILKNENFFKQFVANSLLPNCKEGYKEEEFCSKYLHWGCVNVLINGAK